MAAVDVKVVMNPKFLPTIKKMANKIVKDITNDLRDEVRVKLSVPFPPSSRPGNPPHRRSGATMRSIISRKIGNMDWAVVMKKQAAGRENLGIWLELGTGMYRMPFPRGSRGSITGEYSSPGQGKTSMKARPFLLNTLVSRGPSIAKSKFRTSPVSGFSIVTGSPYRRKSGGLLSRMFGR